MHPATSNTPPATSKLFRSDAPAATVWIRLMVGGVFLSEGLQKFLYPADLGSGRFEKIGIPAPEFFG
ncbi:MAG: DoxX family protein, partial [Verrucomicrobia bacterium]|nr:DoxX family protein [Verrucomicrobiota bacterium]